MSLNVRDNERSGTGVIERNKQHLFKRFMSDIEDKQQEITSNGAYINEVYSSSDEENCKTTSLSERIVDEEPEAKKYEDFETFEERLSQWNVFKRTPRGGMEEGQEEYLQRILQACKLLLYMTLLPAMLALVGLSQGSLLIAVSNIFPHQQDNITKNLACRQVGVTAAQSRCVMLPRGRDLQWASETRLSCIRSVASNPLYEAETCVVMQHSWAWCAFLMLTTPYLFVALKSFWRILFKRKNNPDMQTIAVMMCIETLHCIGLCLLTFIVLPSLDNAVQMCFVPLGLSFVPSCFKLVFRAQGESRKPIKASLDILAVVVQMLVLVVWPLLVAIKKTQNQVLVWSIPLSVLLVSLRWWENYADRFHGKNPFKKMLVKLNSSRTKLQLMTSIWKVLLTLLFMPVCLVIQQRDPANSDPTSFAQQYASVFQMDYRRCHSENEGSLTPDQVPSMTTDWAWMWLVHTTASLLAYFLARSSAKILMQRLCYALPLALSPALMFSLVTWGCEAWNKDPCVFATDTVPTYFFYKCYLPDTLNEVWLKQLWFLALLLWLSQCWTAWHIWFPNSEKLAPADRLFVYPLYDGVILEQCLLHNRRRKDQPKKAKKRITSEDKQAYKQEDKQKKADDFISRQIEERSKVPLIYVCSTMWHETRSEMLSLLKSIFKLDLDQFSRKEARNCFKITDPNFYEFEAHIFFDNAFSTTSDKQHVNTYVKTLVSVVDEAASCVHNVLLTLGPPTKYCTPYGGRLVYHLPGGNILVVHLKDSAKIRHKKRWSQVMYMYYFLSHNLWLNRVSWRRKEARAANIFLMALDGDVGFEPQSMLLLIDLMKRNDNVGAACGRIHPTGSGPLVWYQKFEYALGHWLQKATENVMGCVLCAPGCFSIFRGLALMDENVMATYTTQSTEPSHFIQYDQGEDRWLCTLLLQQGYSVEYCAAADALTSAPEGLYEFFRQRRRWMLSTMANILDLLSSWRHVTRKNEDISLPYLAYQTALFVVSFVGPGTIFLMIIGAVSVVFDGRLGFGWAAFINFIPIGVFILLCYTAPDEYQLHMTSLLTGYYCMVQMLVLVGLVVQMASNPVTFPSTLFFFFVSGTFLLSALMHPQEFSCLLHGFTYYLCIPTMYLLLSIYAFVNLHVVSWGTREDKPSEETLKQDKLETMLKAEEKLETKKNVSDLVNSIKASLLGGGAQEKEGGFTFSCGDCFRVSCCLRENRNNGYDDLKIELGTIKNKLNEIGLKVDSVKNDGAEPDNDKTSIVGAQYSHNNGLIQNTKMAKTETTYKNSVNLSTNQNETIYTNSPISTPVRTINDLLTNESQQTGTVELPSTSYRPSSAISTHSLASREESSKESSVFLSEEPEWMADRESLGEGAREHLAKTEYLFFQDLIEAYLFPLKKDKQSEADMARKLKDLRNKTSCSFLLINAIFVSVVLSLQLNVEHVYIPWFVGEGVKVEPIGFTFMCVYGVVIVIQLIGMVRHRTGTFLHLMASTSLEGCCSKDRKKETEQVLMLSKQMSKLQPCEATCSSLSSTTLTSLAGNDDQNHPPMTFSPIRMNSKKLGPCVSLEKVYHRNLQRLTETSHRNMERHEQALHYIRF